MSAENLKLEFGTVPKAFKKVKDVKMYLAARNGERTEYKVGIWLRAAGEPMFGCAPPREFIHAWMHHLQPTHASSDVTISTDIVIAPTFAGVEKMVAALSENYAAHMKNSTRKKVIGLSLELSAPDEPGCISLNAPSFSKSRILVGIKSEILYEINGRIYRDHGAWGRNAGEREDEIDVSGDLHLTSGWDTVIPYTEAAWQTIQSIEATLVNAARMLRQLAQKDKAQALLEGGLRNLLAGPSA
jgi:hypothetical protein